MLFFVIFQQAPTLLIVVLAVIVWLAIIEVRGQKDMPLLQQVWWVLFVALLNFVGLIILRVYTYRRARGGDSTGKGS